MSNIKFSIIISAFNVESTISKCINSFINQTLKFEENIEIILINDGSKDNTDKICREFASKYPENILYYSKSHEGLGSNKNLGIKYSSGEYIYFIEGEDFVSKETLKKVLESFENNDSINIVSIPTKFLNKNNRYPVFNSEYELTKTINLIENPEFIQIQTNSCFFRKKALKNVKFTNELKYSEDITFINNILIKNPELGICNGCRYYHVKSKNQNSLLNILPNSKYSSETKVKYYFKTLINRCLEIYDRVPVFIQNTILYYLNEILLNETINDNLNKNELKELTDEIKYVLQYIDEEHIYNKKSMDIKIKTFLIYIKNNFTYPETSQFKLNQYLKLDTVFIDIYEIIDGELYILGNINSISPDEKVDVYVNNVKIETNEIEFPQREKYYLNEKYLTNHTFELRYHLDENKKYTIKFKTNINNKLHIDFSRPCNFSKVVGYTKTKKFISFLENNKITITKTKTSKWIKAEIKTLTHMLKNRIPGFETAVPIRIIYMLLYPFLKNKHIWFYMDFPTIADDNGMHLFKYSLAQNEENIKKYFIIDKNSPDFSKMKKIGPVIGYHSLKHRVLGLFAEKLITSHPDNNYIYAFWGHYPNFAGILKSSTIFLQHGITLNNISSWLNKYDKNLDFLLAASKKEYDSLFEHPYNYDKEIIHLLGFPRFDNLKDEKTKTLLLMPSWRRYLTNKDKYTISNSTYFKTYNSLINNTKLIEKAKEYGYKIIFRPHPHVYQYIDLFNENEYVTIDRQRGSYQDLFKKGSLLITDYSSVAFDFAYLKKPVLYYQYGEDYHFNLEESYFDYDTMGFGEVCRSEDELIDLIEEYMKNNCEMKEKHIKNVEDYFLFTDKNNCKRVHEAIKKIPPRD